MEMENEVSYNTDIKGEMEETSTVGDDFSVQQSKDMQTNSSSLIESSTEGDPLQNYFYACAHRTIPLLHGFNVCLCNS